MNKLKIQDLFAIPHFVSVILACENNGNITEITRKLDISSTSMIYPAIDELLKLNIIEDETIKKRGFRRFLTLTEKGEKVLEKLKEIESLL